MIIVFGSINADLVFRVDALPRSGETVLSQSYHVFPGGKGANTAVAAARAGGTVEMIGRVGRDRFAEEALQGIRDAGIGLGGVALSQRPTGCAAIWVDRDGENAIAVASGANLDVAASQVPESLLGEQTVLALQMEVPAAENWSVMTRAKRAGARVLMNLAPAQPIPADALDKVDILVVNRAEAAELADSLGLDDTQPLEVSAALARRYNTTNVITLGRDGAVAHARDHGWRIPALPVDVVDATGAGDAFCGGLAAALDRGLDLEPALRYATVGAGIACTVAGAQPGMPGLEAVQARLHELPELQRIS